MRRAWLCLALAAACSDRNDPVAARDFGGELFRDPGFSDSAFNDFSCATCHRTTADDPAPRIAGSLYDVVYRPSFWGGYAPRLIDAVSFCNVYFMRGQAIDPEDPRGRALYEYLLSISPGRTPGAQTMTVVENVGPLAKGDPARGEVAYATACRPCHGSPHSGSGRLSPAVAIIPEASIGFGKEQGAEPAVVIVEKVRHGQFFGVGGNMPPFSRESLSDSDLGAILVYLGL